jgi:replicative DNA helicase
MSHAHEPPEPPVLYAVPPSDDDRFDTRPPPHDADAERWVLSAVLNDPKGHALTEALAVLSPGDFYLPRHELIFTAAATLHANGEPVDFVTVQNQLTTTKDLSRAGGGPYVYELYMLHANDAATSYYARIVAEHAGRRAILTAGNRLAQLGRTDSGTLADLQQEAAATPAREVPVRRRPRLHPTRHPRPHRRLLPAVRRGRPLHLR